MVFLFCRGEGMQVTPTAEPMPMPVQTRFRSDKNAAARKAPKNGA